MNWRQKMGWLTYKQVCPDIDYNPKSYVARLVVGDEVSWCENAWVIGQKGNVFRCTTRASDASFPITVMVPCDRSQSYDDGWNTELYNGDLYRICSGAGEWFSFRKVQE